MNWVGSVETPVEVLLAAGVGLVVGWWLHRWATRGGPTSSSVKLGSSAPPPVPVVSAVRVPGAVDPAMTGAETRSGLRDKSAPVGTVPGADGYGLARRVLIHLSRQGRIAPGEVARLGFTQRGMADALGVRQGNLAKVLQRLEAADAIEVSRQHVSGVDRRLNVYTLTPLGESVARSLRGPATAGRDPAAGRHPPLG